LDLLVEAAARPEYYAPSPTFLNGHYDFLALTIEWQIQEARKANRALTVRAMWHIGENRPMEAWRDIYAVHRLSRLLMQSQTLIDQLVAIAIGGIANNCTVVLLDDRKLTVEQARQIQRDLKTLQPFAIMGKSIDQGERLSALDMALTGSRDARGLFASSNSAANKFNDMAIGVVSIDWNLVLQETNHWYDRIAAAAKLQDRMTRTAAFAQIESDMQVVSANTQSTNRMLASVISRRERSEFVSATLLSLFFPALNAALAAEDRANTELELVHLAAALAIFRAEHGHYPEKLDELVPADIEKLALDVFTTKPLHYQRIGEGYLLYSAGENGVDDGGSNESWGVFKGQSLDDLKSDSKTTPPQVPAGADDLSIRVPQPSFKMPKVASQSTATDPQ
jgi:hypothetical protein